MNLTKIGTAIAGLLLLKKIDGKYHTAYGMKNAEDLAKSIIGTIRYDDDYIEEFSNFADFIRACCFKSYGYWFLNSQTAPKNGQDAAANGKTSSELYKYYLTSDYYKPIY